MSEYWHQHGFIKASRSTNQGTCVMQRRTDRTVELGDSKDHRSEPRILIVPAGAYADLVRAAKVGELDHLAGPHL